MAIHFSLVKKPDAANGEFSFSEPRVRTVALGVIGCAALGTSCGVGYGLWQIAIAAKWASSAVYLMSAIALQWLACLGYCSYFLTAPEESER
jgi:hypothetical protein